MSEWIAALVAFLLSVTGAGNASEQAARVDPPETTAPLSLDGCDGAYILRVGVGLPPVFDRLARRESGPSCDNNAISPTGCCVGIWQLHSIIFRDHRMIPRLEACGATWLNVRGNSDEAKLRQACAAKALYDVDGMSPWAL